MAMSLRIINAVAAVLSVTLMVLIVTSWDLAGFAIAVTTREIARIHLARFSVEVLSLALVTLALGAVVKIALSRPRTHPAWRRRWLWTAVLLAAASGGTLGALDAVRRGLAFPGLLLNVGWAATSLGVFALVSLASQSAFHRGLELLGQPRGRV